MSRENAIFVCNKYKKTLFIFVCLNNFILEQTN